MTTLAAQFREVLQSYVILGDELTKIMDAKDTDALINSILRNRECLSRIEQMNTRAQQLSRDWAISRETLDAHSRAEIVELAQAVKAQVLSLNQLCSSNAAKLQAEKERVERDLKELGKGSRFLKSVKPVKNNYPKFIDSCY